LPFMAASSSLAAAAAEKLHVSAVLRIFIKAQILRSSSIELHFLFLLANSSIFIQIVCHTEYQTVYTRTHRSLFYNGKYIYAFLTSGVKVAQQIYLI